MNCKKIFNFNIIFFVVFFVLIVNAGVIDREVEEVLKINDAIKIIEGNTPMAKELFSTIFEGMIKKSDLDNNKNIQILYDYYKEYLKENNTNGIKIEKLTIEDFEKKIKEKGECFNKLVDYSVVKPDIFFNKFIDGCYEEKSINLLTCFEKFYNIIFNDKQSKKNSSLIVDVINEYLVNYDIKTNLKKIFKEENHTVKEDNQDTEIKKAINYCDMNKKDFKAKEEYANYDNIKNGFSLQQAFLNCDIVFIDNHIKSIVDKKLIENEEKLDKLLEEKLDKLLKEFINKSINSKIEESYSSRDLKENDLIEAFNWYKENKEKIQFDASSDKSDNKKNNIEIEESIKKDIINFKASIEALEKENKRMQIMFYGMAGVLATINIYKYFFSSSED